MTEILLKGRKTLTHPSIQLSLLVNLTKGSFYACTKVNLVLPSRLYYLSTNKTTEMTYCTIFLQTRFKCLYLNAPLHPASPWEMIVYTILRTFSCLSNFRIGCATNSRTYRGENALEPPHDKPNKMTVRPAKTQISLGICPVWSESSLCVQWVVKDLSFLHTDSEDSD